VVSIASDPGGRAALVHVLTPGPPWRGWFLNTLARQATPSDVYALLAALPDVSEAAELKPYLDRLVRDGDFELALLTWMHFLPATAAREIPYAYNGDFETPLTGVAFDWIVTPLAGTSVDVVETGDVNVGHALRVVFSDRRVRFNNVAKLSLLPPGRYELTARISTDQTLGTTGLAWWVSCAEGKKQPLGATASVAGTNGQWQSVAVAFDVPPTGCRAQWIRLVSADERLRGTALIDGVVLRRAGQGT
jgi:hypothetical protein